MIRGTYKEHTVLSKVFIFIGMLLTGFGVSTILGFAGAQLIYGLDVISNPQILGDFSNPEVVKGLKFMQLLHSIGIFIAPVLFFSYTVSDDFKSYLGFNFKTPMGMAGLTVFVMILSLPLINFMVEINGNMNLPDFLDSIERWMRDKEDSAELITRSFLEMHSPSSFAFNLLIIGIIPAIGEEMLFRGFLQQQLNKRIGNPHAAIWITAFLFSAMHIQFYGFLPRFILGAIFGYLFLWSGSLWIPILAHMINNAGAVTVQYIYGPIYTEETIDAIGTKEGDVFFLIGSLMLVSFLLFSAWKSRVKP